MLLSRLFDTWKSRTLSQHRSARSRRLGTLARPAIATESLECRALLATTILVTNTSDSGAGSLRQAIERANQSSNEALILFTIPNTDAGFVDADNALSVPGADADADVFRISLLSGLPAINNVNGQSVTLDATTQATVTGNTNPNGPEVVLDGNSLGVSGLFIGYGVQLAASSFVEIRGLVIQNFGREGVYVEENHDVLIAGNYIGVDATGTSARPNGNSGVFIGRSSFVTIGGANPEDRNVISGNGATGIYVSQLHGERSHDVAITGNFIGTNATGTAAIPNFRGIGVFSVDDLTIGGLQPGEGNLISGNTESGIFMEGGANLGGAFVKIEGNFIGTDVSGAIQLGNGSQGVSINVSANMQITGNVISANAGTGLEIFTYHGAPNPFVSHDFTISGNHIGTNAAGTAALGNGGAGIGIDGVDNVTIGGSEPGERNVISGNLRVGLVIGGVTNAAMCSRPWNVPA